MTFRRCARDPPNEPGVLNRTRIDPDGNHQLRAAGVLLRNLVDSIRGIDEERNTRYCGSIDYLL